MKIAVKFSNSIMTIYVVSSSGSARIGDAKMLNGMGDRKKNILRELFKEGVEYDMERFFRCYIALNSMRFTKFLPDHLIEFQIKKLENILNEDNVRVTEE